MENAAKLWEERHDWLYVEMDADISPPGRHGHLGMWKGEIIPRRLYFVSRNAPEDCKLPNVCKGPVRPSSLSAPPRSRDDGG